METGAGMKGVVVKRGRFGSVTVGRDDSEGKGTVGFGQLPDRSLRGRETDDEGPPIQPSLDVTSGTTLGGEEEA